MKKSHYGGRRKTRKKPQKPEFPCHTETQIDRACLNQPLSGVTYVVFDIETTGGNPARNGITEIYCVRYRDGEKLDSFYSMVNPKIPIPPIVRRMTGITNAMVKEAPEIETVMPQFLAYLGSDVLVSHNTIGDLKFLVWFAAKCCGHKLTNFFLCTHLLTERLISESKDKSLKGLAKHFEFDLGEVHRAEADAMLTLKLFEEILQRLQTNKFQTLGQAIRLQGDMESALRLGWGLNDAELKKLPESPGYFSLKDASGKHLFSSSAVRLNRDVLALKDFPSLSKPLMKLVLQAAKIDFEECEDVFHAMLKEDSSALQKYEAWNWHGRVVIGLGIAFDEKLSKYKFAIGPLPEGCQYFFGPIHDRKVVQEKLAEISKWYDVPFSKKTLELDEQQFEPLRKLFDGFIESEVKQIQKSRKSLLNRLRRKKQAELRAKENDLKRFVDLQLVSGMTDYLPLEGKVLSPDTTKELKVKNSTVLEWERHGASEAIETESSDARAIAGRSLRPVLWLSKQKKGRRTASHCTFIPKAEADEH